MNPGLSNRDPEALIEGLRNGDRAALSRAITLVESTRDNDRETAQRLLDELLPRTGSAVRVGITGIPGVGKSTFIDAMGMSLVRAGRRVAVLAVDPTSETSGGSILGDKTRMDRLARAPEAFIRPSPAAKGAAGVAPRTREAMLLCEAAGYDVVFVETVGTGQSELGVAHMVDTFVLLALAGTGDELQGIKRGVMEVADVIVLHKSDQSDTGHLDRARADLLAAQRLLHGPNAWSPPIVPCSSMRGTGIDEVWEAVEQHRAHLTPDGITARRREQALHWLDHCIHDLLERRFFGDANVAAALPELRQRVLAGTIQPAAAAAELLRRHG